MGMHATVYCCLDLVRGLRDGPSSSERPTEGMALINASIVGATGYTGAILTDILHGHPDVRVHTLTSKSYAGRGVGDVFPDLRVDGAYVEYSLGAV